MKTQSNSLDDLQLAQQSLANADAFAELYQRSKDSESKHHALEQALTLLSQTEFSVAHLSVATAIAKYGTDKQVQQVMPFIKGFLETEAGQEIQELLKQRVASS